MNHAIDPLTEANDRARIYVEKTGKADLTVAYKVVFEQDPELAARHKVANQKVIDAGGKIIHYNNPDEEATHRADEYMSKHPGVSLRDAYTEVFKADPDLYQRYDQQADSDQARRGRLGGTVEDRTAAEGEVLLRARDYARDYKLMHGIDISLGEACAGVLRQDSELARRYNG